MQGNGTHRHLLKIRHSGRVLAFTALALLALLNIGYTHGARASLFTRMMHEVKISTALFEHLNASMQCRTLALSFTASLGPQTCTGMGFMETRCSEKPLSPRRWLPYQFWTNVAASRRSSASVLLPYRVCLRSPASLGFLCFESMDLAS